MQVPDYLGIQAWLYFPFLDINFGRMPHGEWLSELSPEASKIAGIPKKENVL